MLGKGQLQIDPQWRDRLAAEGLDSFEALIRLRGGERVATHKRRQTRRITLTDGAVAFLKRDTATKFKHNFAAWWSRRRSEPLTARDGQMVEHVKRLGIRAPHVIAIGQRRRGGVASQAVMLTLPLPGEPLSHWLDDHTDPDLRRDVMVRIGQVVAQMFEAWLSWPDLLAKHVFVDDDGQIGLLDLERMTVVADAAAAMGLAQITRFCEDLVACGATEADLAALLAAMDHPQLSDPDRLVARCMAARRPKAVQPAADLPCVRRLTDLDDGRLIANGLCVDQLRRDGLDTLDAITGLDADQLASRGWVIHRLRRRRLRRAVRENLRLLAHRIPTCGLVAYSPTGGVLITSVLPPTTLADAAGAPGVDAAAHLFLDALGAAGVTLPDPTAADLCVDMSASAEGGPVVYLAHPERLRKLPRSAGRRRRRQQAGHKALAAILNARPSSGR